MTLTLVSFQICHIFSHILVAHVPRQTEDTRDDAPDDAMNDAPDDAVDDATSDEPSAAYYHALTSVREIALHDNYRGHLLTAN